MDAAAGMCRAVHAAAAWHGDCSTGVRSPSTPATRMNMQVPESLTIISPHLDDAVFSCGALIAACRNPLVVTVFAGIPPDGVDAPDWDRAAGFSSAQASVHARRQEDARALAMLAAEPVWLDFLDGQYGKRYDPVDIAVRLGRLLAMQPHGTIVAPLGLFHSDHVLVNAACMLVREAVHADAPAGAAAQAAAQAAAHSAPLAPHKAPPDDAGGDHPVAAPPSVQWLFYEDAIYRRMPGMIQNRLMAWWQEGLLAAPVTLPIAPFQTQKMRAIEAYESQLPLFNAEQLADLGAPERYWSLGTPVVATAASSR